MAASLAATDITRVMAYLGEATPGTTLTAEITKWIPVVSVAIERYLNKQLLKAARVETLPIVRPRQQHIVVLAPPIDTEAAVTVTEASDRDFDAATPLEATEYFVDGPAGLIRLDDPLNDTGCARDAHGTVRTTYTGGLALDVDSLEADYPEIVQAANMEIQYRYDKRNRLGETAKSMGGASVSLLAEQDKLLCAQARSLLDSFRRRRISG